MNDDPGKPCDPLGDLLQRLREDGGRYLLSVGMTREERAAAEQPTFGGKASRRWLSEEEYAALCTLLDQVAPAAPPLRKAVADYVKAVKPVKRQLVDDQNFTDEWDAMVSALETTNDADRLAIEKTAEHWLTLQREIPIRWEGGIDAAMRAACDEIRRVTKISTAAKTYIDAREKQPAGDEAFEKFDVLYHTIYPPKTIAQRLAEDDPGAEQIGRSVAQDPLT